MNTIQSRKVGKVTIHAIVETQAWTVIQSIIPDATQSKIQTIDWLAPNYADANWNLKAVVQSFLIQTPQRNILVDACVWNHKVRQEVQEWNQLQTNFLEILESIIPIEKIDGVLCTHLHFDHVWRNTRRSEGKRIPTFPNAVYYFSKKEFDYRSTIPSNEIEDDHQGFKDSVLPIIDSWLATLINSSFQICDEISLVSTPWHTPDHASVLIQSQWEQAFITWDVLHHPCQIAYPNWYTLADTDKVQATTTRKKVLSDHTNENILVLWSHFSEPCGGYITDGKEWLEFKKK